MTIGILFNHIFEVFRISTYEDSSLWRRNAGPSSPNEGVPSRRDAQVVPVYPGQPGSQVRCVPVEAARGPELSSQTLLNILDRLQVTVEDLPQEGDVGDGQPEGVNLGQPLLVREGGDMAPQFFKCRVDACAAAIQSNFRKHFSKYDLRLTCRPSPGPS